MLSFRNTQTNKKQIHKFTVVVFSLESHGRDSPADNTKEQGNEGLASLRETCLPRCVHSHQMGLGSQIALFGKCSFQIPSRYLPVFFWISPGTNSNLSGELTANKHGKLNKTFGLNFRKPFRDLPDTFPDAVLCTLYKTFRFSFRNLPECSIFYMHYFSKENKLN
jgi:hypothetical protein